nr:rRNA maturation RNase YbeY [Salidesulfovibrio onnuriiensis]
MPANPIQILRQCARWDPVFPLSFHELQDVIARILEALGYDDAALTLKLVDDVEIARLNSEFLGCFGPTNVLSFPAREQEGEDGDGYLGEIALSVDTLAREVDLYGQDPVEHLVRLLAHAILHLAGFDHGEVMDSLTETAVDAFRDGDFDQEGLHAQA